MGGHPIRISDPLWGQLESLAEAYGYNDGRGPHAALVRDVLLAAVAEWNESPYVCRSAKHSFLITAEGAVFYRQSHLLHLNSYRERLPSAISMKREKRDYFYRICPDTESQDEWLKRQWLINCFAVWQGQEVGVLLASDVDQRGTDVKGVDLLVRQDKGRLITREVVVAAKDYVQWTDGSPGSDWVEIPIDMPTRNLEIEVFVDWNLYRESSFPMGEIPPLALEFRNRESARFASKGIALYSESPIAEIRGRMPDKKSSSRDAEKLTAVLAEMKARFEFFASHHLDDGSEVLDDLGRKALRSQFIVPKEFLFYRMSWPAPHLGLEVCVGWEKPVKPRKRLTINSGNGKRK